MSSNVAIHRAGESPRRDTIIEVTKSGKKGIPVLISPFFTDTSSEATVRGLLLIDNEDDEDDDNPKARRRKWIVEMRGWVMVLATLAASVTYQAGLNPPGGFWGNDESSNGHVAGNPVLHDKILKRYETFYYFNSTAFVMSVVIIILLMNENFYHAEVKIVTLEITIVLDMISLMGAYIAGSTRNLSSSMYVIVLTGIVFLYVIYMSKVLPNLAYHILLTFPFLEAAARKRLLPVLDTTLKNVDQAKRQGKMSPLAKCCYCCPPKMEQNAASQADQQPN